MKTRILRQINPPVKVVVSEDGRSAERVLDTLDTIFDQLSWGIPEEPAVTFIGQPILRLNDQRWHLVDVESMPVSEMRQTSRIGDLKNTWLQIRDGKVLAEWNIPGFIIVTTTWFELVKAVGERALLLEGLDGIHWTVSRA